jgi:uncharacterized protein YqjF (DUF2071 family)
MAIDIGERPAAKAQRDAGSPGPWRWSQRWRDVLFLHWRAASEELRGRLPAGLELDTYQGEAWVSFVGFRLQDVRLRGWPALPFCAQMLELNFRTYVRYRDEPAIYFLTMHADHRWMIAAARLLTPLPYELARLDYSADAEGEKKAGINPAARHFTSGGVYPRCFPSHLFPSHLTFNCHPSGSRVPLLEASFQLGEALEACAPDSLDAWLTERYVAYAGTRQGRLLRMQVEHDPWQLREISLESCQQARGQPSKCHFSTGVSALLWPFESL